MNIDKQLKVQKDLKEILDTYKSKLIDMYNRANTKSKKMRIMCDLMSFSEIYQKAFPDEPLLCWETDNEFIDLMSISDNKTLNTFKEHVNKNNELYSKISSKVIEDYSKVNYPFYKNNCYSWNKLNRLSNKEIIDITSSFLDDYDKNMYKMFIEKVNNLELLYSDEWEDNIYEGVTNNIDCLNLNYISLNLAYGNNIDTAVTLVHENAHCFEYSLQFNKNISLFAYNTPFSEVCSCFFEYAFLNYLKDNRIYLNDTNLCLDAYYKQIFSSMFEVNLLTKMDDVELCDNCSMHFNDLELNKYADSIKEKVNFYDLVNLGENINVINSYIYGFGRTFGIYMYNNYKKDPELFKRNLNNVLCSYPLVNDISSFESIGISKDNLLNSSIMKKELIKNIKDF